ncbi:hypothetical protein [Nostoc sp. FACHB-888]|uniref:hypothetical protein n=1 Tax=Nostoc sp. FACHB-888 TaxID=2692842 RepID=UPI001686517B|nr:hypothetical protein [Nostoc sp. FACHB-888]MBD2249220.1 hypothetical protein [Nostoc sp. FACHB-888]MBW4458220.1 hypothetical protein [Nostoc indistinguendum CM1-VF10]
MHHSSLPLPGNEIVDLHGFVAMPTAGGYAIATSAIAARTSALVQPLSTAYDCSPWGDAFMLKGECVQFVPKI